MNIYKKKLYEEICSMLNNQNYENVIIDINTVSSVVVNLELGKPSGFDEMTAEHLKYAHPCVLAVLNFLFNFKLKSDFVPDDFARGLKVPSLKTGTKQLICLMKI